MAKKKKEPEKTTTETRKEQVTNYYRQAFMNAVQSGNSNEDAKTIAREQTEKFLQSQNMTEGVVL